MKKENNTNYSLSKLLDLKLWKEIQDNFASFAEIDIRLVDAEGKFLTAASIEHSFCQIMRSASPRFEYSCLPTFLGGEGKIDKNLSYVCKWGLTHCAVPLQINGAPALGYIILGPMIINRPSREYCRELSQRFNINEEELWSALLKIKTISLKNTFSLVELLKKMLGYTLTLAYDNIKHHKESEEILILEALLEVVFEVSRADIGSIMFADKNEKYLTIKVARGLSEDVVKKTKVRIGEGISGLALKEGESFVIDDKTSDNRILPYLNRPHLNSSMVVPFSLQDELKGVMNLGTLKSSEKKFTLENLKLVNRLINLTALALKS